MGRQRDKQRKKFWDALETIDMGERLSRSEALDFVDEVTKSRWWRNRSPIRHIDIHFRKMRGQIGHPTPVESDHAEMTYPTGLEIDLPTRLRLLVSLCHALQPEGSAFHGPEYGRILLEAVKRFCGQEAHDELRAALKARRFKLVQWSEEAKARKRAQQNGVPPGLAKYHAQQRTKLKEQVRQTLAEWQDGLQD